MGKGEPRHEVGGGAIVDIEASHEEARVRRAKSARSGSVLRTAKGADTVSQASPNVPAVQ